MKNPTIKILRILHVGIVFFVIFGWLSPFRTGLWLHFAFVPLMILHWKTNKNRCCLTNLEYRLKGVPADKIESEHGFVKSLLKHFLDPLPSDLAIRWGIYAVASVCWAITAGRLFL